MDQINLSEIIPGVQGVSQQIPRDYQVDGAKYLIPIKISNDFSDPGTGKTLKSFIYLMQKLSQGQKVICVMPPTLVRQYVSEFERIITGHNFTHLVINHSPAKRKTLFLKWRKTGEMPDILLMSFQMWVKVCAHIFPMKHYSALIVDECHAVKNPATSNWATIYRAIHAYGFSYLGMSGTPVTADLTDAYGHIKIKDPAAYVNFGVFERRHIVYQRFDKFKKVVGYKEKEVIKEKLSENSIRVRASDCLSLEEPNIMDHHVHLAPEHRALYKELMTERILELSEEEAIIADNQSALRAFAIRLITNVNDFSEKVIEDVPLNTLLALLNPEEKTLVFCQHRSTIEKLEAELEEFNPAVLYGGRNESEKFKTNSDCKILLANFRSGHAGHNFQVCHNIVMFEADGTPSILNQAIARCQRSGQTKVVNVWVFRYVNTYSDRLINSALQRNVDTNYVMKDKNSLLDYMKVVD